MHCENENWRPQISVKFLRKKFFSQHTCAGHFEVPVLLPLGHSPGHELDQWRRNPDAQAVGEFSQIRHTILRPVGEHKISIRFMRYHSV